MNEKQPETTSSLLGELDDINDLLDTAISKAKTLEKNPNLNAFGSTYVEEVKQEKVEKVEIVETTSRPKGWDNLKNAALEDSLNTFEEKEKELAKNTKQVRSVMPSKKVKLDDNWDDDPF